MDEQIQQGYCMRPMELDDLETVSIWFEHLADLSIFDRSVPIPVNRAIIEKNWRGVLSSSEPQRGCWYAIEDASGDVVGIAGLENINYVNGDGILAVYLADHARRKGLAIIAGSILLNLAFGQLRLKRVTTYYRDDNDATRSLISKMGFVQEGILRQGWFSGGKHHDIIMVGILNDEWPASRQSIVAAQTGRTKFRFGRPQWGGNTWPDMLV